MILIDDADLPHLRTLVLAIAATIALSVYAHGLTASPLTERYVRWWASHPRDAQPTMESVSAGEQRAVPGRAKRSSASAASARAALVRRCPVSRTAPTGCSGR